MVSLYNKPVFRFQVFCAFVIIVLYIIITSNLELHPIGLQQVQFRGPSIQFENFTDGRGAADVEKAKKIKDAMKYTFWKYKEQAWGYDDIKPVTGGNASSRNGWGAFIVDTSTTMALMGLWDELSHEVNHIITAIDFDTADGLVDPFETTIRYLGALVSLTDLYEAGVINSTKIIERHRDGILTQAVKLAQKLAPAYNANTGMMWTRVNFTTNEGEGDPPTVYRWDPEKIQYKNPTIGPARAGSSILENRVLTRLTGDISYLANSTRAWAPLVWNKYKEDWPGIIDGPIDTFTKSPVGHQRHWDAGHDSYYEYLIKAALLAPHDKYTPVYENRWIAAAESLRKRLVSQSSPTANHTKQHLYMSKWDSGYSLNEMSHLACFAPGNLILGGKYLKMPHLVTLGKALLEGCRNTYASTPSGIGPEKFSWIPHTGYPKPTFEPQNALQKYEVDTYGFWLADSRYLLRPEYVESLFYGWRITGEQRYRDWAWEAFQAIEKHCKTPYGYATLKDVTEIGENKRHIDQSESFWGAETLKYLYLTFADTEVGSLDEWVYSTEGHPFRMTM
ncbi:glycoside hydrolase family 47 protein [Patellaria atrata CBS 101060]|uniref:alpha-1,2-Mannosidase n=1 Tax=Patellaria atrata CBS 101060 TaxID=1346257 RepID=A0A9P4S4Q7_9PEZI|nr:glycoside hydrolase family 47 protein [Patellaria atrata CBS 101060]